MRPTHFAVVVFIASVCATDARQATNRTAFGVSDRRWKKSRELLEGRALSWACRIFLRGRAVPDPLQGSAPKLRERASVRVAEIINGASLANAR